MIGDTIRKYRKANQMSQDELAEKLNVTRQSISLWENGQTQPSLDSIVAMAKLFNVSTDTLLTEDGSDLPEYDEPVPTVCETPATMKKPFPLIIALAVALAVLVAVMILILNDCAPKKETKEANVVPTKTKTEIVTEATTEAGSETAVTTTVPKGKGKTTTPPTPTKKQTSPVNTTKKPTVTTKAPVPKNFYSDLKAFVLKNGQSSGDSCFFVRSSDTYGGAAGENFNAIYWANNNELSICLHCPLDADHVLNVYIFIPQSGTSYRYTSSYCYQSGESIIEASGSIPAGEFTSNYPLACSNYYGDESARYNFMETSRSAVCDLLSCLRGFLSREGLGYSMSDIGFKKF